MRHHLNTRLLMILLLLSCGCAGGKVPDSSLSAQARPAAGGELSALLPGLQELRDSGQPERNTLLLESEMLIPGSNSFAAYEANVDHSENPLLIFNPDYTPEAAGISGIAYATYRFSFLEDDFDRAPQISLNWDTAPQAHTDVWLAVSDWDRGRWHFAPFSAQWRADFQDFEAYYDESGPGLYAAILVLGDRPVKLESLRLGGLPPAAIIDVSPRQGAPPLEVTLDASASLPGEGTIVKYEWDLDGDSIIDLNSGSDPVVETTYSEAGSYWPLVRVTSSLGLSSEAESSEIEVSTDWQRSLGRTDVDMFSAMDSDTEGNLYLAGYLSDPAPGSNLRSALLARLSASGEVLWVRSAELGEDGHYFIHAAVDSSGDVLLCGIADMAETFNDRVFVQRWSPAGALLWSRYLYPADGQNVYPTGMALDGGQLYIAGSRSMPAGATQVFAASISADGQLNWDVTRGSAAGAYGGPLVVQTSQINPSLGLSVLAGSSGPSLPLRLDFDLEGNFVSSSRLLIGESGESFTVQEALYQSELFGDPVYHLAGSSQDSQLEKSGWLVSIGSAGSSIRGRRFSGIKQFSGLGLLGGGRMLLSGLTQLSSAVGPARSWLALLDMSDCSLDSSWEIVGTADTEIAEALPAPGGILYCGYAPDKGPLRLNFQAPGEALSASWESYSTTGSSAEFLLPGAEAQVSDVLPLLTLDSGAGSLDGYVAYRQLLDN